MTAIRDAIFPVGSLRDGVFTLCGTGSLLGDGTTALTASHVVDQAQRDGCLVGLFVKHGAWAIAHAIWAEHHPDHDVAVFGFAHSAGPSIIQVSADVQLACANFHSWGYPDYVAEEDRTGGTQPSPGETASSNPDLIFRQGYVRRRMGWQMPYSAFKGSLFFELNEVFGSCCSGAPLILMNSISTPHWKCMGVYVGEQSGHHTRSVGIAVPADGFASWTPTPLGRALHTLIPTAQ